MLKALALVGLAAFVKAAPAEDKVDSLPQMPDLSFGLYSGYLPITGTTKQLHYMFAQSQRDPTNDPVIVWFNGGPGCSSMLGFTQEHGPYVMEDGASTFHKNDYSWNKEANMLYIESPAGVGYSYCNTKADCAFNDDTSATDNLAVILEFFTSKFPEFQKNDLYISGESYAGIYVPYVAYQIDQYNTQHANDSTFKPNLKGYMVGNGVTNWDFDTTPAYIEMAYWHGLYDTDMYNSIQQNKCEPEYTNFAAGKMSKQCLANLARFEQLTSSVNIYDVYGYCYTSTNQPQLYESKEMGMAKVGNEIKAYKKTYTAKDYTPWAFRKTEGKELQDLPPCTFGLPIIDYLNSQAVRQGLHIPNYVQAWDLCKDSIDYTESPKGSQWVYSALKNKYKILFYSGDTDGAVPTYGTLQWINQLNWNVTAQWRPYFVQGQVAGYVEERDGMTFVTVHGAGHMAPQWKRPQTYYAFFSFVNGTPL